MVLENEPTQTTRPLRSRVCRGLYGPAAVAELAVVVVLDDGRVVALGPGQQGQAPGQRHRHPQRELVRGGDDHHPGSRRHRLDHQPLGVDRHPGHVHPQRRQQPPERAVPGGLDGDPVAGVQQDPGDQVDRLLGAVGDHHVLGAGQDPAGDADVRATAWRSPGWPVGSP
jgi:hypothetical protein